MWRQGRLVAIEKDPKKGTENRKYGYPASCSGPSYTQDPGARPIAVRSSIRQTQWVVAERDQNMGGVAVTSHTVRIWPRSRVNVVRPCLGRCRGSLLTLW
jgi:hypothetical protein